MADEPNSKMDQALKAYARKRRQEAGADLELHPASRRLLQGEVTKLHGRPASGSTDGGWLRFLPRVGFALSIAVALGVVYWSLRPPASQFELAATSEPAPQSRAPSQERANDSVATVEVRESEVAIAQASRDASIENADVKLKDMAEVSAGAAKPAADTAPAAPRFRGEPAPAAQPTPGMDFAKRAETLSDKLAATKAETVNPTLVAIESRTNAGIAGPMLTLNQQVENSQFGRTLYAGQAQGSNLLYFSPATTQAVPLPTAVPSGVAAMTETLVRADSTDAGGVAQPELAFYFAAADTTAPPSSPSAAASAVRFQSANVPGETAGASTILRNFELRQSGDKVRVVDADGSVYEGVAVGQTDSYAAAPVTLDESQKPPTAQRERRASVQPSRPAGAANRAKLAISAYGTNRTLNQVVLLKGTLESDSAATNALGMQPSTPQSASNTRASSNQTLHFRGQVRVGPTNEMSINAIRVR